MGVLIQSLTDNLYFIHCHKTYYSIMYNSTGKNYYILTNLTSIKCYTETFFVKPVPENLFEDKQAFTQQLINHSFALQTSLHVSNYHTVQPKPQKQISSPQKYCLLQQEKNPTQNGLLFFIEVDRLCCACDGHFCAIFFQFQQRILSLESSEE